MNSISLILKFNNYKLKIVNVTHHIHNHPQTASRYCSLWTFPFVFPLKALRRIFSGKVPHPSKWWFVLLSNQCGTSQFTPHRDPHSFLPSIVVGSPPSPLHFGASVLTGTPPHVYPLRGTTRKLTYRLVSGSDTIVMLPRLNFQINFIKILNIYSW